MAFARATAGARAKAQFACSLKEQNACRNYLNVVTEFCQNQNAIEFTGSAAWVYKGWKELNRAEGNPWHDHNPSFLSGVYYLHDPGDGTTGGTEFHDPRTAPAHGTRIWIRTEEPYGRRWVLWERRAWDPIKYLLGNKMNPSFADTWQRPRRVKS